MLIIYFAERSVMSHGGAQHRHWLWSLVGPLSLLAHLFSTLTHVPSINPMRVFNARVPLSLE